MAAHFPTSSDYFDFHYQALPIASNYTMMAWLKAPATWTETLPVALLLKWGTEQFIQSGDTNYLQLHSNSVITESTSEFREDTDGGDGLWHHLCIRRTSATSLQLLFDGTVQGTDTNDGSGFGDPSQVYIGSKEGVSTTGWQGDICQVRIWTTNLSDGEVTTEKASPTLVKTANCYGSWALTTGTDTVDASGNGRTLTISGTPTTSADDPTQGGTANNSMWSFS